MNAPDLHPEELLDRAAQGTLTPEQAQQLQAHLAQCPVCRFEQEARADFTAPDDDEVDLEGLVTRALAGLPAQAPPRRPRLSGAAIAAVVALSAVTSFAAAGLSGALPRWLQAVFTPEPKVSAPAPAPRRHEEEPPVPVPVAVEESPVAAPAVEPPPPPPARKEAPAPPPRSEEKTMVAQSPATADLPPPAPPAPEVFAEANRARARGDLALASTLYLELQRRYPAADEAVLSHALLGRLLLDRGDAESARGELETYLGSGHGALREEALASQAKALQRLGRASDEARAWSTLLAEFPDSLHGERARSRLKALDAP